MTGHRITIPRGWRLDKAGKLVKCTKHLDVSTRLKVASSKRVRVGRRGRP